MLSAELFKKIQNFHFKTKYLASDLFAGQYESAYKGRGMEFAEVREYTPGDDIRLIDWNVSARFGQPYVKVLHEERELTVMLLLDLSGSHLFGTRKKFKRELLTEIAGMLAFLATRTNDKVGAMLFSSRVEKYIPAKKGASHVWRLIKEIFTYEPVDTSTDIQAAFDYLNRIAKRHAVVFLISDCMDRGFEKGLRLASKKHDLTVVRISDPSEQRFPDLGLVHLQDPETGEIALVNTRGKALKDSWQHFWTDQQAYLDDLLSRTGVDLVDIRTDGPLVEPLVRLFEKRKQRK